MANQQYFKNGWFFTALDTAKKRTSPRRLQQNPELTPENPK